MEIRIFADKSEKIEFVRRCVAASFSINIVYFRTLLEAKSTDRLEHR